MENPLARIARWLRRTKCKELIKFVDDELSIKAAGAKAGGAEVNVGEFSNKKVKLAEASKLAVDLDKTQYLLCQEIASMEKSDPLADECKRIRLQIILGFSQLQGIVSVINSVKYQSTELQKQLNEWLEYMGDLHKIGMRVISPHRRGIGKGKTAMKVAGIMKYQSINQQQLREAVKILG